MGLSMKVSGPGVSQEIGSGEMVLGRSSMGSHPELEELRFEMGRAKV